MLKKIDPTNPIVIMAFMLALLGDMSFFLIITHWIFGLMVLALLWSRLQGWTAKAFFILCVVVPGPNLVIGIFVAILLTNKFIAVIAQQVAIQSLAAATGGAAEELEVVAVPAEAVSLAAEGAEAGAAAGEAAEGVAEAGSEAAEAATEAAEEGEPANQTKRNQGRPSEEEGPGPKEPEEGNPYNDEGEKTPAEKLQELFDQMPDDDQKDDEDDDNDQFPGMA